MTKDDHKDEWKIQLSLEINFVPSKDSEDPKNFKDLHENRIM